MNFEKLRNFPSVAVIGPGSTGLSVLRFWQKRGPESTQLTLIGPGDPRNWEIGQLKNVRLLTQEDPELERSSFSMVVISPGVDPRQNWVQELRKKADCFLGDVELASWFVNRPLVCLTGSNGKTTTTTLLSDLCKSMGLKVFTGGNIGVPVLDLFESAESFDLVLWELSSFQLETAKHLHPHMAGILNLTPTHMERYDCEEDYFQAKWKIQSKMTDRDFLLLPMSGEGLENLKVEKTRAKLIESNSNRYQDFLDRFDFSQMLVLGEHNRRNFFSCFQLSKGLVHLGLIDESRLLNKFQRLIDKFKGVEHRLEFVSSVKKTKFYNDSKSTNILSTLTALKAVVGKNRSVTLLMGGRPRGEVQLSKELIEILIHNNIPVVTFGEVGRKLEELLQAHNIPAQFHEEVGPALYSIKLEKEQTVLFSPGFPSFDQYKNFERRGIAFKELVTNWKESICD